MKHNENYLKVFLLFVYTVTVICSDCPKKVKYSIKYVTSDYTYETGEFEREVIAPENSVFSITLEENIPVLCKEMLNITQATYHFYGWNRSIRSIEAGAFENQNLQSQLHLSNNLLSVIRKGTFKNILITDLDLSYNEITTIEEGAVEDLPKLSILYLTRNKIKEFHPNSVVNTPELLFFDMTYNNMEELEDKHFFFMSKKRNVGIGLGSNKLKQIHPNAFEGIDVFTLNLTDNKLESIPKEVFSENRLQYLSIAYNKLTHLDDAFFELNTTTLRDVELKGNNFDEETIIKLESFLKPIEENKKRDRQIRF